MAQKKTKGIALCVFKGREAKLNRAIFRHLAEKGPQTIYEIHRNIKTEKTLKHTRYANVNLRVRQLDETGYVKKKKHRKTKAGFQATIYELTPKTFLTLLLNLTDFEKVLEPVSEKTAYSLMADLLFALS